MNLNSHLGTTDPARCGCGREATGSLMPVDEALARALERLRPVTATERLALGAATGRVLAGSVRAPLPVPPFDVSTIDGYAVRLSDLPGDGPWCLPVAVQARPGDQPLPSGIALRIRADAALPLGATAVIPQEQAVDDGTVVRIRYRPRPGAHVFRAGDDFAQGTEVLPSGRVLGPREVAALTAAGQAQVEVRRRLEVALLATGCESVAPCHPRDPESDRNASRFALPAQLAAPWVVLHDLGTIPDDLARLRPALVEAAGRADLLVTVGGVSAGNDSPLPRLVRAAGGAIHVRSVAMRPGDGLTIGEIGGTPWIGLPGSLMAAFVAWTVIGARVVEAMAGIGRGRPHKQVVRLGRAVAHRPGRCEFRPARLLGYDGQGVQVVEPLAANGYHRVTPLAQADGLALVPADAEALPEGTLIEFLPF